MTVESDHHQHHLCPVGFIAAALLTFFLWNQPPAFYFFYFFVSRCWPISTATLCG